MSKEWLRDFLEEHQERKVKQHYVQLKRSGYDLWATRTEDNKDIPIDSANKFVDVWKHGGGIHMVKNGKTVTRNAAIGFSDGNWNERAR